MNPIHGNFALAWHGLPAYAARLIKAVGGDFPVIATKPQVPIAGMEELLPGRISWIDETYCAGWAGLGKSVPKLYFQPSWCTPSFNLLGEEVRAAGGKVIVMFDNPWRGDFRQFMGAIRFRTQWRNRFCAAWVAGQSGARLAKYWGFDDEQIFTGMYGSDPDLFHSDNAPILSKRPKRMIFVGQLIERKGINELLTAWGDFNTKNSDWELHVYGTGALAETVKRAPVVFHGFQQPDVIATGMLKSRFLVLPSHEEHWGVVVCEAAQSCCGLILSDKIGSGCDLGNEFNRFTFKAGDASGLTSALVKAAELNDESLVKAGAVSQKLSSAFTPKAWAVNFNQMVSKFGVH